MGGFSVNVLTFSDFGGPGVFRSTEQPTPEPQSGEVRIRVTAAGVNRADLLQREGKYPPPADAPPWPGLEVSGIIDTIGREVRGWSAGDRVCALIPGGGYAEYCVAPESLLLPAPSGISLVAAAGLPEAACTVWSNLRAAGARPGETILIHGGSGGIGTLAIQIAKAHGMRVLTTARGPARAARCLDLGADHAIDYSEEDFAEYAKELGGVDVILDVIGGLYLSRNIDALALGGRLVIIGLQGGTRAELDLRALMEKRAQVLATTLRTRPLRERAMIVADVRENVWPLIPDAIQPVVHAVFPLEEAGHAHEVIESGEAFGKVLLAVGDGD